MAHVHIGPDGLSIDGVKVPVLAEDFEVDLTDLPRATVRCTIPADVFSADLPDAVLDAKWGPDKWSTAKLAKINARLDELAEERDRLGREIGEAVDKAVYRRGGTA